MVEVYNTLSQYILSEGEKWFIIRQYLDGEVWTSVGFGCPVRISDLIRS